MSKRSHISHTNAHYRQFLFLRFLSPINKKTHKDRRTEGSTDIGSRRNADGRVERKDRDCDEDNYEVYSRQRRHERIRDNNYYGDNRRPERERFHRDGDRDGFGNDPADRSRYLRERSDSEYYSDDGYDNSCYDSSRRRGQSRFDDNSGRRRSSDRSDHRRRYSEDYATDEDDVECHKKKKFTKKAREKSIEWPPSFQKKESAFVFDARSAMFYEPLSDFFYDPKSKLYYGNKKSAYFRYDETKDPPFVEVQKLTSDQVEEQKQQGDSSTGIIEPEKIALSGKNPATAALTSKPKIAIRFKTKKVKSSMPAVVEQQQPAVNSVTVSKAKQQQIANIGKWNEKQAELKKDETPDQTSPDEGRHEEELPPPTSSKPKVRTTAKGEPICLVCKRKFPNLAKLRLHEKSSELHKKNLLKLQEKKNDKNDTKQPEPEVTNGTKRKLNAENRHESGTNTTAATTNPPSPVYTDRAEKRRQLHGVDLGAPVQHNVLHMLEQGFEANPKDNMTSATTDLLPSADILGEKNVGHKLLQKMGYQADHPSYGDTDKNPDKPKTASDHLRKEWDRIEAIARKSVPRYR